MELAKKVRQFIIDNFLFGQTDGFSDDTSFLESGIVNSTGMLEVIAFIEETYNIQVDDSELLPENLDSVNKLTSFVQGKRKLAGDSIS